MKMSQKDYEVWWSFIEIMIIFGFEDEDCIWKDVYSCICVGECSHGVEVVRLGVKPFECDGEYRIVRI